MKTPYATLAKIYTKYLGHMTKMTVMSIYDKNPLKSLKSFTEFMALEPSIVDSEITPDQIRASQVSDPTLARICTVCKEQVIKGNAKYFKKKDLIYGQFGCPKVENGCLCNL